MPIRKVTALGVIFSVLVSVCFAQGQFDFDKALYIKPVDGSKGEAVPGICTAPDFLDTELSLFMRQLLAQGAAAESAAA